MGIWRRWRALAALACTGSPEAAAEYQRELAQVRARRAARRRRGVPDDTVSWCANAPSLRDAGAPAVRDEWAGVTGMGAEYPPPDHDDTWLGTIHQPYATPRDVGKRRR